MDKVGLRADVLSGKGAELKELLLTKKQIKLVEHVHNEKALSATDLAASHSISLQYASMQLAALHTAGYLNRSKYASATGGHVFQYTMPTSKESVAEIFRFPGAEITPDIALNASLGRFKDVLIIGYDHDGDTASSASSSFDDRAHRLLIIKQYEHDILAGFVTDRADYVDPEDFED